MASIIVSSGVTSTGLILKNDSMYVSGGGAANSTTVNSGGVMFVSSGGLANNTAVNDGELYLIGGRADMTTIYNEGCVYVSAGGVANNTTVNSECWLDVSSGGVANSTMVNSDGWLDVSSGGVTNDTTVNSGGTMLLSGGGTANNTTVYEDGYLYTCDDNAVVSNLTIESGGTANIAGGGFLTGRMTFDAGAYVSAAEGTVDFDLTQTEAGAAALLNNWSVLEGIPFYTLTVRGNEAFGVYSLAGGVKYFDETITVVNSAGTSLGTVSIDGGTADIGGVSYTLNLNGGILSVTIAEETGSGGGGGSGGSSGGSSLASALDLTAGMTASALRIVSGGTLTVLSGGVALDTTVNSRGRLTVSNGGVARNTTVNGSGRFTVSSGGTASNTTVNGSGRFFVSSGGTASGTTVNYLGSFTVYSGGLLKDTTVNSGGHLETNGDNAVVSNLTIGSGGSVNIAYGGFLTGRMNFDAKAYVYATKGTIDFDLSQTKAGAAALMSDWTGVYGDPIYTLTVRGVEASGIYNLAGGAEEFDETITVVNTSGVKLGTLDVDGGETEIDGVKYTLNLDDDGLLSVTIEGNTPSPSPAGSVRSDINANGFSDVMFQYIGGQGQIGFWMDGTSSWQSTNTFHPVDTWEVLGAYDMNANGKADSVLVGNVEVGGVKGAFVGYYVDANDTDDNWVNISYLTNNEGYVWKNKVGNLTGNEGKNSIVWHSTELGALGVWTDGTDNWVSLGAGYDSNWTLVGCGNFIGSGKDSVVMSYGGGQKYYEVSIDGAAKELATSDSGWEVRAIADFAGDGKDDIVAFHKQTGIVAMWGNGSSSNWSQLGQLDPNDWFVAGAGDYNGDGKNDLLVRQYSTGMLGYYSAANMSNWTELGRGVDMSWTVIA